MKKLYKVEKCIYCGQSHTFSLILEKEIPVFGGPNLEKKIDGTVKEWGFTCPNTQKVFSEQVNIENGYVIKGVVSSDITTNNENKLAAEQNTESEFRNWINESRTRGINFSTTMLTTSTGAIGVYFAIEKYLGVEKILFNMNSIIAVLPPLFYLIASLFFILALKPKLSKITTDRFENFRQSILEKININNTIGLFSFFAGNIIAVYHFIYLLI